MSYYYIKNKTDFEDKYPYDKKYISEYPSKYPCVVNIKNEEGGLNGDFYIIDIIQEMTDFIYKDSCLYKKC